MPHSADVPRPAIPAAPVTAAASPLAPGATIGVLGGGQLGRMLGFAARALGFRMVILDPDPACPARPVADDQIVAGYDDVFGALELAAMSDVLTYELEHVDARAVEAAAQVVPVRPGLATLRATQDRLAERRFLRDAGAAVAPWRAVHDLGELRTAAAELGYPLRLKASIGGYDGRSQVRLAAEADLEPGLAGLAALGAPGERNGGLLLERELDFDCEVSVVCARSLAGEIVSFPVTRNVHDRGVLAESTVPAALPPEIEATARGLVEGLAERLGTVGMLTAELFVLRDGTVAVNELAPRVHNSGHWTIEGARTSQFAQHVRAICGLPLGSPDAIGPAAMVNLLGTGPRRPARLEGMATALADPLVHVHVYGKREVFDRRKMGHVTVVGDAAASSPDEPLERARQAWAGLRWAEPAPTAGDGSGRRRRRSRPREARQG